MSIVTDLKKQRRTFRQVMNQRQPVINNIAATMGDGQGNLKVTGKDGYVWVTINGAPYKAFCNRVPPAYNKDVWVGVSTEGGKSGGVYQVLSDRAIGSMNASLMQAGGYAPASRYAWGGDDPLGVDLRAFMPLRIGSHTGGMLVDLYRGYVNNGTTRFSIPRQDIDVSAHIPTTVDMAAFVLISIDDTGAVIQTKGSEVAIADLAVSDIPVTPAGTIFESGAVRVYYGQTEAREGQTNTDFVDLRFPGVPIGGGNLNFDSATELVIASGAVTVTQPAHKLQPESGTADYLETISGTEDGDFGVFYASDFGTDTITIKHNTGNILCLGGTDVELSNGAVSWFSNGTKVFIVGSTSGSGASSGNGMAFVRCSVVSGDPNPTTDQTAKTAVYVMPYGGGNTVPVWNGVKFIATEFVELTATLNATYQTAGNVYDLYLFNEGTTMRAGFGVAWSSATSRGTGSGTAEVERVNGVDVNKNTITLRNGATSYSVSARYATLVGTIQIKTTAGQLEWSKRTKSVCNRYNKLPVTLSFCPGYVDNDIITLYYLSSTTFTQLNGDSKVSFVLDAPQVVTSIAVVNTLLGINAIHFGVGWDSVTSVNKSGITTLDYASFAVSDDANGYPLAIGSHYASLLGRGNNATAITVYADYARGGSIADPWLTFIMINLEM